MFGGSGVEGFRLQGGMVENQMEKNVGSEMEASYVEVELVGLQGSNFERRWGHMGICWAV